MFEIPTAAVILFVAGFVLHMIADWFLQNDWMSSNKAKRRSYAAVRQFWPSDYENPNPDLHAGKYYRMWRADRWWDRHPAGYVHAGIHTVIQLLVFPVWGALIIGVTHYLIDLRTPLTKWKKFYGQTTEGPMGVHVAIWLDQVFHWTVLAIVALLVA